jgi:hypothetical protein
MSRASLKTMDMKEKGLFVLWESGLRKSKGKGGNGRRRFSG